ncbi:MAG: hypothetical protein ACM3IH_02250 [Sphingobacteriales bacterium]
MSPDFYFALTLIVKMAITAAFVVAATVTAERVGPLIGGLVATLPIGAGPVYVFLALDHDAHFIAQSAVASLAINAVNVIFALSYALLAQTRSRAVSMSLAFLVWLVFAGAVHEVQWSYAGVAAMNLIVISICLWLARPLRHVRVQAFRTRWTDMALRAGLVALLVGVVVTFSFQLGPAGSGILAVFPVVLISIMFILHSRVGGPASAAVMANAVLGLVGFAFACTVLHFSAEAFGSAVGLTLALVSSVGWSLAVLLARRHGVAV